MKVCCFNCRFYDPPKRGNAHGLCNVVGAFAGTLRPEPVFSCLHFAPTVARRLKGDEEPC